MSLRNAKSGFPSDNVGKAMCVEQDCSRPPPTVNDEHRRPQPLERLPRRKSRPDPREPSTSHDTRTTSPHFSTLGAGRATMVALTRLSPTRAPTEQLAEEPPEPGSDWYFGHDDIDTLSTRRISRAPPVCWDAQISEALLSLSSQSSRQWSIRPSK